MNPPYQNEATYVSHCQIITGMVGCSIISVPIPLLLKNPELQNIWMAIGLVFCDLALIQGLLLWSNYKCPGILFAPNLAGILSGVGAAIYQVLLLGNTDWVHLYATIILFFVAAIYSTVVPPLLINFLDPNDNWIENRFLKKLTSSTMIFSFLACPTGYLIHTIIHFPASWTWIYVNYGLIVVLTIISIEFLRTCWTGTGPNPSTKEYIFMGLYIFFYTPFSMFSMIKGFRECQAVANPSVTNQYFTFLIPMLGSTCVIGILVYLYLIVIVILYCFDRIKKLFGCYDDYPVYSDYVPTVTDADLEYQGQLNNQLAMLLYGHSEQVNAKSLIDVRDDEKITEEACSICWTEFNRTDHLKKVSGCNHTFHASCLEQWCQKKKTCPVCRANLK